MLQFFLRAGSGADPRIPVGGVLLRPSSGLPAGWEAFTTADTRALMGAATLGEVGPAGHSGTGRIELSGTMNTDGGHSGTAFDGWAGGSGGSLIYYEGNGFNAGHTHTFAFNRNYNPALVDHQLMRRTGTPGNIPVGAGLFGAGALPSGALDEIATYVGRVLRANSSLATIAAVSGTGAYSGNTSSDGSHVHGSFNSNGNDAPTFDPITYAGGAAGNHSHVVSGTVSAINLPVGRVAHFEANTETVVPVGAIIAFSGDESNIKGGWRLCDGANGSLDLRNRYLEIVASGSAGVVAGDGTVVWTESVASAGAHTHQGASTGRVTTHVEGHSNTTGAHTHTWASRAGAINLRRYLIRFIQFLP